MVVLCLPGMSQGTDADKMLNQAEEAYSRGMLANAGQILDECIKQYPGFLEAYFLRGTVRERLKDPEGALTDYSIYLEAFPDHQGVLLNRALVRYQLRLFDQAKEDFLHLLELPAQGETNTVFFREGMTIDQRKPIMTMTSQNNQRSHLFNYLGLTEAKLKHFDAARIHFDSAIRIEPKEADYWLNRGLIKEVTGDSTAEADYLSALKINSNHVLAKHNLKALKSKRQVTSANFEERLSETIDADPDILRARIERAQKRFESGNFKGAADDYSAALNLDPDNPEVWLGRGLAKEKLNDLKGAFADYTEAIERREDFLKAWINRGNVLLKMKRYEDAVEDYTVSMVYNPNNGSAYYNRAIANWHLKKLGEACNDLQRARRLGIAIDSGLEQATCNASKPK